MTQKTRTRDHFIPRAAGGACLGGNIVSACPKCNVAKANRFPTRKELVAFIELYGHFPGYQYGKDLLWEAMGSWIDDLARLKNTGDDNG